MPRAGPGAATSLEEPADRNSEPGQHVRQREFVAVGEPLGDLLSLTVDGGRVDTRVEYHDDRDTGVQVLPGLDLDVPDPVGWRSHLDNEVGGNRERTFREGLFLRG